MANDKCEHGPIGTKIFQFVQREAEKIRFQDFYLISESNTFYQHFDL